MHDFTSEWLHKVDAKGRVSLPAEYRRTVENAGGGPVVVLPKPGGAAALEAYTLRGHTRLIDQIRKSGRPNREKEALQRVYVSRSRKLPIDENGRIVLPDTFRAHAELAGTALFAGMGATFQIWRPESYRTSDDKADAVFREIEDELVFDVSNE